MVLLSYSSIILHKLGISFHSFLIATRIDKLIRALIFFLLSFPQAANSTNKLLLPAIVFYLYMPLSGFQSLQLVQHLLLFQTHFHHHEGVLNQTVLDYLI